MARPILTLCFVLALAGTSAPEVALAASKAGGGAAEQVVTTRPLQRGAVIRDGDVSGPFAQEDYVGRELVRSVRAGAVMSPRHVRTPLQVKRNETVTLVFRQGALTMETTGRSLGEGATGDRVSVINTTSRKRVTGRIAGQGIVEVTP
ncbi:MAG: flagellar basal body P-ring formation chaperone FlgA [Pseudomonadota bacterium]